MLDNLNTTPGPRALLDMLAAELDAAREQLEALGMALCGDAQLSRAFPKELQALDHAGQRCMSVASILRSSDPLVAAEEAPLESIAGRLAGPTGSPN